MRTSLDPSMLRRFLAHGLAAVVGLGLGLAATSAAAPAHRVLALLSFNVGIELAQLAFVAVVIVPLARLAQYEGYRRFVLQGASLVIAACGGMWLVERAAPGLGL